MDMNTYQRWTESVAIYPRENDMAASYLAIAITSEVGELASLIKRKLRDGTPDDVFRNDMKKELGDVLWYLARLADEVGFSLGEVAEVNMDKLMKRQANNSIHGKGDDR